MSRPARDRAVPAVAIAGIAVFAGYKLWQCLVGGPLVWQDSLSYQQSAAYPLDDKGLWAGARPPVTPLLWKLTGTITSFVVVQTVVSILAWSALAVVVALLARRGWPRLVAGGVVLGFAATTPIVQWDRSVLSESISLSLLALLFATAILWAVRPTGRRGGALVAVALVFAATRDTHIWVVALLALALGVAASWYATGRRARLDPNAAAPIAWVTAGLAVVVFLTGWGSAAAHRTEQNIRDVYDVRIFPYVDRIDWFADHGMPDADGLRALARTAKGVDGNAPFVGVDTATPEFAALGHWLHDHGTATYVEWLLTHPGYVLSEPLQRPERTFNNAGGHLSYYAAPDRTDVSLANWLLYPPGWVVLVEAVAAVGGAVSLRRWRRHEWQITTLLGVIGIAHVLIAWHGDGMEVTRHAAIGNVQMRLAVLVVLGMLLPRRTGRSEHEDEAESCSESGTTERSRP
jgi:hypothetical protein